MGQHVLQPAVQGIQPQFSHFDPELPSWERNRNKGTYRGLSLFYENQPHRTASRTLLPQNRQTSWQLCTRKKDLLTFFHLVSLQAHKQPYTIVF